MLTGALWLSLLGACFNALISGPFVVVNTQRINQVDYWVILVGFIVSIYAIYCTIVTFKMKKRGAYGLLSMMAITVVLLLLGAFYQTPTNDDAKAGAGWMLIMAVCCVICAIIVALHLKKME